MLQSFALAALIPAAVRAQYTLTLGGSTGIAALGMTVATNTNVVLLGGGLGDDPGPSPRDSTGRPAHAAVYSIVTNELGERNFATNSMCSAGTWLSNGTLISIGGNSQAIRLFGSCTDSGTCDFRENPERVHLTSLRWYPSSARLSDGSAIIYGGAYHDLHANPKASNNPTYEFYPPKNIHGYNGLQIPSQFLKDTRPHNMLLPNNDLFVAANNLATTFDWETNTESRLPNLPNGQHVSYPKGGVGDYENNYKPEVLLCGESQLSGALKERGVSSRTSASQHCSRIALDEAGKEAGWSSEPMPEGLVSPDGIILPDGKVLIVSSAKAGTPGHGNACSPVLYDPNAPAGSRFSSVEMDTSDIALLQHSVSTLLPDGRVMIAGPGLDAHGKTHNPKSESQVKYINLPYMNQVRPSYAGLPKTWNYGQSITISVALPSEAHTKRIKVSLMDLGFTTHGVHMDMRMVELKCTLSEDKKTLTITGPPNAAVYPPGPAWVYVLVNGVPSEAHMVLIGTGASPPVNQAAIDNMLANTSGA